MGALIYPLLSLLFGIGLLLVGIGLLFPVLGLRAAVAEFPVWVTGLVMSAYFAGFMLGTYLCPVLIRRVGYIRAFAAMASIASFVSPTARPLSSASRAPRMAMSRISWLFAAFWVIEAVICSRLAVACSTDALWLLVPRERLCAVDDTCVTVICADRRPPGAARPVQRRL